MECCQVLVLTVVAFFGFQHDVLALDTFDKSGTSSNSSNITTSSFLPSVAFSTTFHIQDPTALTSVIQTSNLSSSSHYSSLMMSSWISQTYSPGNQSSLITYVFSTASTASLLPTATVLSTSIQSTASSESQSPAPSVTNSLPSTESKSQHSSTMPQVSSSAVPTLKPAPSVKYECGPECKSLKKRLWIAGFFAVLFAIAAVILGVLFVRQRRIAADVGDPALSRLI